MFFIRLFYVYNLNTNLLFQKLYNGESTLILNI